MPYHQNLKLSENSYISVAVYIEARSLINPFILLCIFQNSRKEDIKIPELFHIFLNQKNILWVLLKESSHRVQGPLFTENGQFSTDFNSQLNI